MAVTATIYNSYKAKLMDGSNINLATGGDTIKIALTTSSYTPDIDTHDFYNDITNELATGDGYTTGGETLANQAVTTDTTDNEGVYDADNVVWTFTALRVPRYAVIYKSTGTSTTSPLIGYIDLGSDYTIVSGTLTLTFDAEGIININ